jgi:hypothetical protein
MIRGLNIIAEEKKNNVDRIMKYERFRESKEFIKK